MTWIYVPLFFSFFFVQLSGIKILTNVFWFDEVRSEALLAYSERSTEHSLSFRIWAGLSNKKWSIRCIRWMVSQYTPNHKKVRKVKLDNDVCLICRHTVLSYLLRRLKQNAPVICMWNANWWQWRFKGACWPWIQPLSVNWTAQPKAENSRLVDWVGDATNDMQQWRLSWELSLIWEAQTPPQCCTDVAGDDGLWGHWSLQRLRGQPRLRVPLRSFFHRVATYGCAHLTCELHSRVEGTAGLFWVTWPQSLMPVALQRCSTSVLGTLWRILSPV